MGEICNPLEKRLCWSFLALLVMASPGQLETDCSSMRPGAFSNEEKPGICYFVCEQYLTWESAVDYCQGEGWSLVDVEDATENDLLTAKYNDINQNGWAYWIGQNDREVEDTWKYASSDTHSAAGVFLKFHSGQPNGGNEQNCIAMVDYATTWHDRTCSEMYRFTCKQRINNCPAMTRPNHFVFVSSDRACRPEDALIPGYHTKSSTKCARDCLLESHCLSFSYATAGKHDNCQLCNKILDDQDLEVSVGSVFYKRAA